MLEITRSNRRNSGNQRAYARREAGSLYLFTHGRLCLGMMEPLIRRRYGTHARILTSDLRGASFGDIALRGSYRLERYRSTSYPRWEAHSDAQWQWRNAARALPPRGISDPTQLPKWFAEMYFAADVEAEIYLFELAATIHTACEVDCRPEGNHRTCVLRVDNKAAPSALRRGSPSSTLGTVLVNLFWSVADRSPFARRFEYVDTR